MQQTNPYPNRPYDVGMLNYTLPRPPPRLVQKLLYKAQLEFGEGELLYDLPRRLGAGLYCNLGHGEQGGSAQLMALGLLNNELSGHVHSVDCRYTKFHKDIKNLTCHRMYTTEFDQDAILKGDTWKFVFIDADHSYEGVKGDFLRYSPNAELVGFHDTNQEYSYRVLEELVLGDTGWVEYTHVNRIRIFIKEK